MAPRPAGPRPARTGAARVEPAHSQPPNRDGRRLRGFQVPREDHPPVAAGQGTAPVVPGLAAVMVGEKLGRLVQVRPATIGAGAGRLAARAHAEASRPSTWRKGPSVVPQKEQRDPTPRLPPDLLFV